MRPCLHGDGAVRIVDRDDGAGFHLEVLFHALGGSRRDAEQQKAGHQQPGRFPISRNSAMRAHGLVPPLVQLRQQVCLLLIRFVEIIPGDLVFGLFVNAFFTQSNVVVNNRHVFMERGGHYGVRARERSQGCLLDGIKLGAKRSSSSFACLESSGNRSPASRSVRSALRPPQPEPTRYAPASAGRGIAPNHPRQPPAAVCVLGFALTRTDCSRIRPSRSSCARSEVQT